MIACRNCGQLNDPAVRICRYCGSGLAAAQAPRPQEYAPPPPYVWANESQPQPAPVQPYAAPHTAAGYRCPRCGTTYLPIVEKKVSSEGWLVFALMLFLCIPLCWIGLLMKQEYRVCPMCHAGLF